MNEVCTNIEFTNKNNTLKEYANKKHAKSMSLDLFFTKKDPTKEKSNNIGQ